MSSFRAVNTSINAFGCEFAEASSDLVLLAGGSYRFDQCTASNNYLFTAISGSAWHLLPADTSADEPVMPTEAIVTNSITHGYGGDVAPTDLTKDFPDVRFQNCMFKANGTDDDNFVSCIWDADPLFYTVRDDYYFDYRVRPDSRPSVPPTPPSPPLSPPSTSTAAPAPPTSAPTPSPPPRNNNLGDNDWFLQTSKPIYFIEKEIGRKFGGLGDNL